MRDPVLSRDERRLLEDARRAVLATLAQDGRPRLVPICFVVDRARPILYTPLDEKPKAVDNPWRLTRVLDIRRDPRVSVLVDRWDEDWSRLGWVRIQGAATILEPWGEDAQEHAIAVALLRLRYEPYREHDLETRPIIRVTIQEVLSWGALGT